jgi:hypothetical protein
VSKLITKEPRDYQKAGAIAIAAQQLFGSGVKLRHGQMIEHIHADSKSTAPNDRVRGYGLWEGWFGYDPKKYAAMLREAFQRFELFVAGPSTQDDSARASPGEDWVDTPLFCALRLPRHRVSLAIAVRIQNSA